MHPGEAERPRRGGEALMENDGEDRYFAALEREVLKGLATIEAVAQVVKARTSKASDVDASVTVGVGALLRILEIARDEGRKRPAGMASSLFEIARTASQSAGDLLSLLERSQPRD